MERIPSEIFVEPVLTQPGHLEGCYWNDVVKTVKDVFVICGGRSSGKSLILKMIARFYAANSLRALESGAKLEDQVLFPIYIDLVKIRTPTDNAIANVACRAVRTQLTCAGNHPLLIKTVVRAISNCFRNAVLERFVFLFDHLEAIGVRDWLMRPPGHDRPLTIFACNPDLCDLPDPLPKYEISLFDAAQVSDFLRKWGAAANMLETKMQQDLEFRELMRHPYLLNLACQDVTNRKRLGFFDTVYKEARRLGFSAPREEIQARSPSLSVPVRTERARDKEMGTEIGQLQEWFRDEWDRVQQDLHNSGNIDSAHKSRVALVDKLIQALVNSIEQVFNLKMQGALVARGGYGLGYLSSGSDIDISFIHTEDCRESAEASYSKFRQWLFDFCTPLAIKSAPMISTASECLNAWNSWKKASDPRTLQEFVSLAGSHFVHGDQRSYDEVVKEWNSFSAALSPDEMRQLTSLLRTRIDKFEIQTHDASFNLKGDAGGITECRLVSFIDQLLTARGITPPPAPCLFAEAATFLLVLREGIYKVTSLAVLLPNDLGKVVQQMTPLPNDRLTWAVVTKHRRAIRAQFVKRISQIV